MSMSLGENLAAGTSAGGRFEVVPVASAEGIPGVSAEVVTVDEGGPVAGRPDGKPSTGSFEEILAEEGALCTTNVGVSMLPLLREGKDIMVIRPVTRELRCYDAVLFHRPGVVGRGAYVLHRVLKVLEDGCYWIVGDNCTEGEVVLRENIIGILTDVRRGGKSLMDGGLRDRLYLALWVRPYRLRFGVLRLKSFVRRCVNLARRGAHLVRRSLRPTEG